MRTSCHPASSSLLTASLPDTTKVYHQRYSAPIGAADDRASRQARHAGGNRSRDSEIRRLQRYLSPVIDILDALVVGAGIYGLTTAFRLARSSWRVAVVEAAGRV